MTRAASALRPGLLAGVEVAVASAGDSPYGAAVRATCSALGATLRRFEVDPFGDAPERFPADVLVWDGAGAFAAHAGVEAVRAALDGAWLAIRASGSLEGGKVVLLAPPRGDEHAAAARAGLENLARTLSIEWARYGVRTTTVLPGKPVDAADVVAYIASVAGDYFSGTALTLR